MEFTSLYILAALLFLFFAWFAWVSFFEKEPRAGKRSLILALVAPIPFIAITQFIPDYAGITLYISLSLVSVFIILCFIPFKKVKPDNEASSFKIDERDTMFSRNELTRDENKSKSYYEKNPDKLAIDKEWHSKPGLMDEKSAMYNPIAYAAADASFFAIEELRNSVDGKPAEDKKEFSAKELSLFVKNWSKKLGAIETGICELKPHHFYSHRGRGEYYGKPVNNKHKYGIAFTVEMDKDFTSAGPGAPIVMESAQQYMHSGSIAVQLAQCIRNLGYEARAHIDGNYEVVCPLIARDAGLGEIGRMGLLMTPKLGPRVRIAIVSTDLPLVGDDRNANSSVHDFCEICKKCAEVCPSSAISSEPKKEINGLKRWQINQEKCFSYWCTSGTDCGRCMSTCPYSHPDNLMHNMVRWGIQHSWFFRRIALAMDDFFYGKKPKPAKTPDWLLLNKKE